MAVHNNTEGGLSIHSYAAGGSDSSAAADVAINAAEDPDDFFYVTGRGHFEQLKALGYNVVLQANGSVPDDGSLSVFCDRNKIVYVNVEAQHGHGAKQAQMLLDVAKVLAHK